jgi:hypothetical protein
MEARRSARQFRDLYARKEPGLYHPRQVESKGELSDVFACLRHVGGTIIDHGQTMCRYAKSEKSWIDDPSGIPWEMFFTRGESMITSANAVARAGRSSWRSCLAPEGEHGDGELVGALRR